MAPTQPVPKYVYDLPVTPRNALREIFDADDDLWKLLAESMHFTMSQIAEIEGRARRSPNASPTDILIEKWSHGNHRIVELYILFYKLRNFRAMKEIQSYVPREYVEKYGRPPTRSRMSAGTVATDTVTQQSVDIPTLADLKSYRQLSLTGAVGETSMADGQRLGRAHRSQPGSSSAISSNRRHRRLPEKTSEDTLTKVTTLEPESGPRLNNLAQKDTASPSPTQIKVRQHSNVNVIRNNIPHTTRTSNTGTTGRLVTEGSRISPGTVVPGGIPYISYQELSDATECFHKDNLLGRGGFGAVYLGTWKGTRVAIKRMEPRIRNQAVGHHEDFFVEYAVLNQFRHTNILELFGVSSSDDGNAVCLIYKFMKNGSLQDRLNCKGGTAPLTWEQRVSIALGVACGLRYLHTLSSKPIVHGDIKSANILLDEALTPKLGDFGLAREGPDGIATHVEVSRVKGTPYYLPPDYLQTKALTDTVDTYSFGVVLYDMSTGKCGYVMMGGVKRPHREAVEAAWKSGSLDGLRDERPLVSRAGDIIFRRFIELGRKCTAYQRQARPGMVQVHEMLLAIQAEVEKLVESPTRELSLSVSSSETIPDFKVEHGINEQAKTLLDSAPSPVGANPVLLLNRGNRAIPHLPTLPEVDGSSSLGLDDMTPKQQESEEEDKSNFSSSDLECGAAGVVTKSQNGSAEIETAGTHDDDTETGSVLASSATADRHSASLADDEFLKLCQHMQQQHLEEITPPNAIDVAVSHRAVPVPQPRPVPTVLTPNWDLLLNPNHTDGK